MTHSLAIRLNLGNPNHHLWNNNGTWFVHYTIHPTPFIKQRIRASLETKDVAEARLRRDQLLSSKRDLEIALRRTGARRSLQRRVDIQTAWGGQACSSC